MPSRADVVADEIRRRLQAPLQGLRHKMNVARRGARSLRDYERLVRKQQWIEIWPDGQNGEEKRLMSGEIWNEAIQAALGESNSAFLPARRDPYYLDRPIVLRSGQYLLADREAEIRLKPNTNTCMVRNENIVSGQDNPLPSGIKSDTDIVIEGGIWTTLATTGRANGNKRGCSAAEDDVPGGHGVILLQNVRGAIVRNLMIRQSRAFGIHLGNASEFLVDGVRFDRQGRDGVHIDGPSSFGVIRKLSGDTHDDTVSLTALDWKQYSVSFGLIHHVLVERVMGAAEATKASDSIRLLPGAKRFNGGGELECPIQDCVVRDVTDIREFKLYDQPNLELGRDKDHSERLGRVANIHVDKLILSRPGVIQVAAEVEGLSVNDVHLNFDLSAPMHSGYRLVEIGPMSHTYKRKADDPSTWVEVFSPDKDVKVRDRRLTNVYVKAGEEEVLFPSVEKQLVRVADQTLNLDYPKTTPRGGRGRVLLR